MAGEEDIAGFTITRVRAEIAKLLQGADLAKTSIGILRKKLEQALGVEDGTFEPHREKVTPHIKELVQAEVNRQDDIGRKKRKLEKDKKDKDKKEKKEKKLKKQDTGDSKDGKEDLKQEADAEDSAQKANAEVEEKAVEEEGVEEKIVEDQGQAEDEGSEEEEAALEAEEVRPAEGEGEEETLAAVAPAPAVEAEVSELSVVATAGDAAAAGDSAMGMSAFEAFTEKEATSPQPKAPRERTWALSGAEDGYIRLWDLDSSDCVQTLAGHDGAVRALAVDWEQMRAVSGADDNVRLWNLTDGTCERTFLKVEQGCAAVVVDWKRSRILAGCGDGRLRVYDMDSGELLHSVEGAHSGGVWALEADWERERVASGGDEHLKVWDATKWTIERKLEGHPGGLMCLAVDWATSRALVGAGEQSLRLWDLASYEPKGLAGHHDAVSQVCASWEAGVAVSGGWDAEIRIWNLGNKNVCVQTHESKFGRVRSMAVDFAQLRAICGSSDGSLHLVDLHSGVDLRKFDGHVGGVLVVRAKF